MGLWGYGRGRERGEAKGRYCGWGVCVCKEGGEGKSAGGTEKGCSARLGEPHTPLQPACPCRSCPWVRAGRALVLDFDRLMPSPSWSRSERMRTRLTTKVPPVQHPSRCSLGVSCSIAQASAQNPRRSRSVAGQHMSRRRDRGSSDVHVRWAVYLVLKNAKDAPALQSAFLAQDSARKWLLVARIWLPIASVANPRNKMVRE